MFSFHLICWTNLSLVMPEKKQPSTKLGIVHSNTGSEPILYISFYFSQPFNFKERIFMKVQFSFLSTATYTPWSHETTLGLILKIPQSIPKIYFLNTTETGTQKKSEVSQYVFGRYSKINLFYIALSYLEKPIFKFRKKTFLVPVELSSRKQKYDQNSDFETKFMVIIQVVDHH